MLNERRSQIAIGFLLLAIGAVGVALAGGKEIDLRTQRHVVVNIFNLDGTAQVFVDCEQAAVVTTGEARELDLGRMPPDARIAVSAISHDHRPAWGFEVTSNGRTVFTGMRGHAKVLGFEAEANAVVVAKAFTAGGDYLGPIGCQEADLVDETEVPGYLKSPDEYRVPAAKTDESPFRPSHFPYDQIDALGGWSLTVLAVLGVAVAIGTPSIRRPVWSHKWGLATGALAVLGAGVFQIASLPTIMIFAGTALFFAVASLLVLGEPRMRRWYRRLAGPGRGSRRSSPP